MGWSLNYILTPEALAQPSEQISRGFLGGRNHCRGAALNHWTPGSGAAGTSYQQPLSLTVLKRPFAGLLGVMLLLTLGNSSNAFLILRAQHVGIADVQIPIVYAIFNLVSALSAIPAGKLSDRIGRRKVITYGWAVYAITYLGFP